MRHAGGIAAAAAIAIALTASEAAAQSEDDTPDAAALAAAIETLRAEYEARIGALEEQLDALRPAAAADHAGRGHDDHDHHGHDDHGHDDHGHDDHDEHGHDDHDDHGHDEHDEHGHDERRADAHDAHDGHDDHGHDDHGHDDEHDDHGHEAAAHDGGMGGLQVGAVLRSLLTSYTAADSEIAGFRFGHEGERPPEGFSLGHSELSLSSDIGDALRGGLALGLGAHPGESAEVEIEEAYVETLPGAGLPEMLSAAAGRKLWSFGYLNERHAHEDDFADRPLPYRAFLDNAFNDDGVQLTLALPGTLRGTLGGGLFRGSDQPFGASENGRQAFSAFARVGGQMGRAASWGIGASLLSGKVADGGGHAHAGHDHNGDDHAEEHGAGEDHDDEHGAGEGHAEEHGAGEDHDDEHGAGEGHAEEHGGGEHNEGHDDPALFFTDGTFSGARQLVGIDARFAWTPGPGQGALVLQGEYLWQTDDGVYTLADAEMEEHLMSVDGRSAGWYAQAVYDLMPAWQVGMRYARLTPPRAAEAGHDPGAFALMGAWRGGPFGSLRLQYNRESLARDKKDDQVMLQYTLSLGAPSHHDH